MAQARINTMSLVFATSIPMEAAASSSILMATHSRPKRDFFNCQIPELIKALREIAVALSKPAPAAIQLADTGEPDFLHNLFYGNYEPDIYGCVTVPSRLDQNVKEAEKALLPALGQSQRLFEQYQTAVSERDSAIAEQSYCCGYRTAVQMIVSGLTALPPQAGGEPDEQ